MKEKTWGKGENERLGKSIEEQLHPGSHPTGTLPLRFATGMISQMPTASGTHVPDIADASLMLARLSAFVSLEQRIRIVPGWNAWKEGFLARFLGTMGKQHASSHRFTLLVVMGR